jgi:hypothetical protein
MSIEQLIRILNEFVPLAADDSENSTEQFLHDLMENWKQLPNRENAIPAIFHVLEKYPHAYFGSPGPLVHGLESPDTDYQGQLQASLLRKPTPLTLWMYNRIINAVSFTSYGQQGKFNPFKLIVLQPDTAIIDPSLYHDIDSVQSVYIRRYYSSVKQMEDMLAFNNYPPAQAKDFEATKEKVRKDLPLVKAKEEKIKQFKYFQTLSAYSTEVYNFYYNEYAPYSTILEYPAQKTDLPALKRLADSLEADYIVFFMDIHTGMEKPPLLQVTTRLYSHRDNRTILTKTTEGDYSSQGDMWTCAPWTLSCLLINGVRTSTNEVAPELAKRQLRK